MSAGVTIIRATSDLDEVEIDQGGWWLIEKGWDTNENSGHTLFEAHVDIDSSQCNDFRSLSVY